MTPEQWALITARLSALQAFVIALCEASPDQDGLRANLESQMEILKTVALHSDSPEAEAHSARVQHQIQQMIGSVWGKDG